MRALLIASVATLAACAAPRPIDGKSAYAHPDPIEIAWLRSAVRVPTSGFHRIEDVSKLPPNVRGDVEYWDERLFPPGVRPIEQAELEVFLHAATNDTPDLVRFHYHHDDLDLTVDESTNFAVVWVRNVRLASHPQATRAAVIADAAKRVLNMKGEQHDWVFGPPQRGGRPGEDGNFSTNPQVDPDKMSSWEDRADGGVMHGVLYFFLYKKNPNRPGYENAQNWFSDDLKNRL